MKNIISTSNMNKQTFKSKTKDELIQMLLKQNIEMKELLLKNVKQQSNIEDDNKSKKPIPTPRKSVKQMVQDYEENIILPPPEFRDDFKPVPLPWTKQLAPVPLPRTKIEQVAKALKGYTKSFEIGIKNNKDPLAQLQNTRKAIEYHIVNILTSMKGLKFVETLKVTFEKLSNGEIVYKTAHFNSKAQTIINNIEIPEALQLSKQQILNMIAQWVSEGSGRTIQSVDNHYLNIVQYQSTKGSSYIKLPQELRNNKKG